MREEVAVLRANQSAILAYLARRVANVEDAADLFGETYLTAWRRRRSMPVDPVEARKWLFVVARNTLLNHRRSTRRRAALTEALRRELLREAPPEETEQSMDVRRAIAALDEHQGELVRLIHWDGFSITDAAEVIGIPASTARSRYAAARSHLQELLAISVE